MRASKSRWISAVNLLVIGVLTFGSGVRMACEGIEQRQDGLAAERLGEERRAPGLFRPLSDRVRCLGSDETNPPTVLLRGEKGFGALEQDVFESGGIPQAAERSSRDVVVLDDRDESLAGPILVLPGIVGGGATRPPLDVGSGLAFGEQKIGADLLSCPLMRPLWSSGIRPSDETAAAGRDRSSTASQPRCAWRRSRR